MKKFLKLFSVFALICCCVFSFAGCDIFKDDDTQNEYASLIAERKIVREVVNNTQAMLTSGIEQEQETLTSSSEISAKSGQNDVEEILNLGTENLRIISVIFGELINDADFVPGKLYSFTIDFDGDIDYFIMNAYCDGDNIVTLNAWSSHDKVNIVDSVFESVDIYYNEKYEPIKTVQYHHEYETEGEYLIIQEMTYSSSGEAVTFLALENSYGEKSIQIIEENIYNEYSESNFTEEMRAEFNASMELLKERTSLFAYARPLSQEAQDKISDIYQ